jgi:hypothetical protein
LARLRRSVSSLPRRPQIPHAPSLPVSSLTRSSYRSTTSRPIISVGLNILRSRPSLASRTRSVALPHLVAHRLPIARGGHTTGIAAARWRRAAGVLVARGGRSAGFPVARGACAVGLPVAFVNFRSRVSGSGARRLGGGRLAGVEAWGRAAGVSWRGCAPVGGRSEPERRRRPCPRRRPD